MIYQLLFNRCCGMILMISFFFVTVSCGVNAGENELAAAETEATPRALATESILPTVAIEATATMVAAPENGQEEIFVEITTPVPSLTATSWPLPTSTTKPWPTAVTVACQHSGELPDKAFPEQVDMSRSRNQRVAISYPYLYLATEQYLGLFDISDPAVPRFLGFWNLPDFPDISTLRVDNSIAYFTSGSRLVMLNLSPQCRFETIATIDIPFQIFKLDIENKRLYLGGFSEEVQRDLVAIFSIEQIDKPEELGIADLGEAPASWTVFEETIYVLGEKLIVVDVANPAEPQTQEVNLALDLQTLSRSPSQFFEDRLYVLWGTHTVTVVSHLREGMPVVKQNPVRQIIGGNLAYFVYQVSENYIFLGDSRCDASSCNSAVTIFDAQDGKQLTSLGIHPKHYPVRSYYEITPGIIYAFSDEFLLVIDVSDITNPVVIAEVPLIT